MILIEDKIDGRIDSGDSAHIDERMFLYALIRAIKPKVCVETGTHKALTTLYMANALYDNGEGIVHSYDPFEWEQERNIEKFPELRKHIVLYKDKGENVNIDNIDFAFIDGYHEEEFVLAEMKAILPRLTEKAVVVFHDCGGDNKLVGVNAAIKKLGLETSFLPTANDMRIYGHFNKFTEYKDEV